MKNNTEISLRIRQMIDFLKLKPSEFATALSYNRPQAIYDMLNAKANPSFDFFERLYNSEYSVIFNYMWIISGDGPMINDNIVDLKKSKSSDVDYKKLYEERTDLINMYKEKISRLEIENEHLKKEQQHSIYTPKVAESREELKK